MTFQELLTAHKWKPIPNCPGRYVLEKPEPTLSPNQLAQVDHAAAEYRVKAARDIVLVLLLDGASVDCTLDGPANY